MDLAWNSLRTNNLEEAEQYLNRAMAQHATDPDVYRQAGQAYLAKGDRERARELLQRSLTLNPRDLLSIDALAGIEEEAGDRAAAERLLRSGLEVAPANSYLLGRLGHFYLRHGERQKARELFQQVLATNPADVETWLALAELYYQDSDWNGLRILEQTTTQRLATNSRFHSAFGAMAVSWGDYHRARTILELALRLAPGDLRTRSLLSRTFLHLELDDRAIDVLKEADSHLGTPALQASRDMMLAATYSDLLRHKEAESTYRSIYLLDPANFDARRGYLISLLKQGRQDEVERELDVIAREFNNTHEREVQLLRASILRERGEYPRAQALLRELANRFPEEHDITLQLAVVASDAGDLEEAERSYRQLLALGTDGRNPWFETASNNLGYMFATKGIRLDEAEQLALAALEVNPRAGYILDTVGVVYLRKGDFEKARLYLERAARFSLRDVEIYTNLGELYEKIGEHELAQQMYDRALAMDPSSRLARERRDALAEHKQTGTQTRQ
jgi:tetratricopeptide (TPR) repeat protein